MNSPFRHWSDVPVFLSVMRNGSTLSASKALGIAQPTVARRIDAVENSLGLTLFERNTRGFQPTESARALLPFAEAMEAAGDGLAEEARRRRAHGKPIRITLAPANFASIFKTIFAEFRADNPETRFEFISADRPLDLLSGEADVAIRHGQSFEDTDLICRKLSEGKFALYASRSYCERNGIPRSVDDLRHHAVIDLDGAHMPKQLAQWTREHVADANIAMTCHDWPSMAAAIETGVGVGPLGTVQGDDHEDFVRCFELPPGTAYLTMLLASPQAYRRKDVKKFIAFFAPRYSALSKQDPA